MVWKLFASSALTATFGIVFTMHTNNGIGVIIGFVAAAVFLTGAYVSNRRSSPELTARRGKSPEFESESVPSMGDLTKDAIRRKLEHPDLTIQKVDTDDGGAWFANIISAGHESNLRRVIGTEFDVCGKAMRTEEGTHARLTPNLEGWNNDD